MREPPEVRVARRVAIVTTHVIQYQDPFFKLLAADPLVDLTVLFCSPQGAVAYRDAEMGTSLSWDLDLLQGYSHRFLRNLSRQDMGGGFWRAVNPGIASALARGGYDMVVFMTGWGVFTAWLGYATCALLRIPIFLYGDSCYPPAETSVRARLRARLMRTLCAAATGYMVTGALNADYYRHYGADPSRFFPMPWAIDNERFAQDSRFDTGEREALRGRYGIAPGQMAVVFSGKLIARKDPMILLRALERMQHRERAVIVLLGNGVLREPLERYARENGLADNVRFAGFVNQTDLPKHYAMADVFALPSYDDPRATVINEAMACGLPLIVSDRCGPVGDIAADGDNAFVLPPGDVAALAAKLDLLAADPELRGRMAQRSREIIATWNYAAGVEGVKRALRWLDERGS